MDRNTIITILNEWNFWNRELPSTIFRKRYEDEFTKKLKLNEIIFLKGVRRSGKSTLLINFIKNLLSSGISKERILFINLEDSRFANYLSLELLEDIKNAYLFYLAPSKKPYIFLDEIQNIPMFEKWLLKEYELNKSYLIATGSNSKLLSKEIGSSLSGRYIDIEVMPLSFKEFLFFKDIKIKDKFDLIVKKLEVEKLFQEYLKFGGFPKVALINEESLKAEELKMYFDSIILRDIVARYRLENFKILEQIAIYLLSNISNYISINLLKKFFGISYDMVNNYLEYIENAYLIFRVPKFSWSLKKQQANPRKIYAIDNGLASNVFFQVGKKLGDLLENIVFLELKRRFNEIYYYKTTNGYEVDFVIKQKEKIISLIQVCFSIKDEKIRKREIRALLKAKDELKLGNDVNLIILTTDSNEIIEINGEKIYILNIIEWLVFNKEP